MMILTLRIRTMSHKGVQEEVREWGYLRAGEFVIIRREYSVSQGTIVLAITIANAP